VSHGKHKFLVKSQVYFATNSRMIRRLILDITKGIKLFDTFMVGHDALNLCLLHYGSSGDVERINVIVPNPIGKKYKVNTHVGRG